MPQISPISWIFCILSFIVSMMVIMMTLSVFFKDFPVMLKVNSFYKNLPW